MASVEASGRKKGQNDVQVIAPGGSVGNPLPVVSAGVDAPLMTTTNRVGADELGSVEGCGVGVTGNGTTNRGVGADELGWVEGCGVGVTETTAQETSKDGHCM